MRLATAAIFVLAAACTADEPTRWLVVPERVELCAMAPDSTPLEQVQATQWRFGIAAGEYVLPDPQPLPRNNIVFGVANSSPIPSLFEVRDVDGANPFDADPEGAVLRHANLSLQPDDARDVLRAWSWLDSMLGESGLWQLLLVIEAETGEDFRIDGPPEAMFACHGDVRTFPCPNRSFDACDPSGPTVRTRVTLDRGEVVLDVRYIERMPIDGDPTRVMFVATQVHLDEVALVQHDFFRLLHAATHSAIGDGSYAVLSPEALEPAGLGCGIAITDVGTEDPRAAIVDCTLQELEPLVIVAIAREVLP
jgi:hypothetical protein